MKLPSIKNRKTRTKIKYFYLAAVALFSVTTIATDIKVYEDEIYTERDEVALYIYEFDELPVNYIPKEDQITVVGNDLYLYAEFRNDERLLPLDDEYTEAYINAVKGNKGKERLVFSDDMVYYTDDHYKSFEILATSDILMVHRTFLITTAFITITGPTAMAVLIKKDDELSYSIIKEDTKDDFKYLKRLASKSYVKVKEKIEEITQ